MAKAKKRSARVEAEKRMTGLTKMDQKGLEKLLNAAPDNVWKPETEGEIIAGVVVELKDEVNSRFDKQPPYTVLGLQIPEREEGDPIFFVGAQTSSRQQLAKLSLKIGDKVAIRYDGETPTRSGFDAKLFKVVKL